MLLSMHYLGLWFVLRSHLCAIFAVADSTVAGVFRLPMLYVVCGCHLFSVPLFAPSRAVLTMFLRVRGEPKLEVQDLVKCTYSPRTS